MAVEDDLKFVNLGVHSALKKAKNRDAWKFVVRLATPPGMLCEDDDNLCTTGDHLCKGGISFHLFIISSVTSCKLMNENYSEITRQDKRLLTAKLKPCLTALINYFSELKK